MMGEQMNQLDVLSIIISIALTWCIGLAPPLLIRFAILKKPLNKWPAIGICAFFWLFNLILFMALAEDRKAHTVIIMIAFASYWVLRKKVNVNEDKKQRYPAAQDGTQRRGQGEHLLDNTLKTSVKPRMIFKKILLSIGFIVMLIVVGISKDIGKHFANAVSHSAALAEKADSTQNPQITSSLNPGGNNPASAKSTQSEELNFECATWERSPEETLVNEMDFARNQKAAAAGSADGQYALGIMYAKGEGVSTDYVKAVEWYQKAAAQGHVNAQASLGEIYMLGNCIPKDTAKAQEWLQKAATQGNADAQFNLGEMYDYGKGVPEDDIKAFEWYKKAAAQGNAQAQASLGFMYDNGEGVPEDDVKAVEWLQKAAAQGLVVAQFNLGVMYDYGKGVPEDSVKAIEWFQKAAEQGNAQAQANVGFMYATGEGVPEDDVKAVEWFQKAAAQGNVAAQLNLGYMYRDGKGVSKDARKSVEWFQKAADQGFADAQFGLGEMYGTGEGVPKDAKKSLEWFQKAAAQGFADAQTNLGYMYKMGEGVAKNIMLAYAWSNLAAAQGNAVAQSNRDIYEKQLSYTERMEGQRLASNWKKGDALLQTSGSSSVSATPKWDELNSYNIKERILSKQATGTAFTVTNEGHALTNHHVINGCTEVKVAGREGVAKVITSDSVNDLALLQLPFNSDDFTKLNPDTGKLRQGEDIIVFGYPLNWALSSGGNLTPGTVSALTGLGNNTNQIQITAPIQPGSSGSPVMDKKGNVIAVVSMMLDDSKMTQLTGQVGQNVNFAVNGQTVKSFLDANKVPYKTGGGLFTMEKSNADIADEARKWTVLVECWK